MPLSLSPAAPARLLECLRALLPAWKRKTLEQRVRSGCVRVNGTVVLRPEAPVAPGDAIELADAPFEVERPRAPFPILHDDAELVAIDKPAELLAVGTDEGGERNTLALLRAHLGAPLWPVHRLDRETSGVLLFAKSRAAQQAVQADWEHARKFYLAIVEGRIEPVNGTIDAPLWEDARLFVHAGAHPDAKPARTRYRTLERGRTRTLLEVELDTGRKHQIRVHLASRGCPVVGDERYGTPAERLGLHAWKLALRRPSERSELVLEAPPPRAFSALLR
ncbi:MAG: RluA family pseudouridine synthase [Planctomycetes bacterium]|nr:RluA family pseudouridine synthase [Planctomycetota bacterium]